MSTKLYVGNLPFASTAQDLQDLLSQVGTVASVDLILDKFTGRSRGFAFVEMSTAAEAQAAIQKFPRICHGQPQSHRERGAAQGGTGPAAVRGRRRAARGGRRRRARGSRRPPGWRSRLSPIIFPSLFIRSRAGRPAFLWSGSLMHSFREDCTAWQKFLRIVGHWRARLLPSRNPDRGGSAGASPSTPCAKSKHRVRRIDLQGN